MTRPACPPNVTQVTRRRIIDGHEHKFVSIEVGARASIHWECDGRAAILLVTTDQALAERTWKQLTEREDDE